MIMRTMVFLLALLVAAVSTAAAVPTATVSDGRISTVGSSTMLNVTLSEAPSGLSGYNVTVSLSNTNIAEILSVEFPGWAALHSNGTVPGDSVWIKSADLNDQIKSGASNVFLAAVTVRGDRQGSTNVLLTVSSMDDDSGNVIDPLVVSGKLDVGTSENQPPVAICGPDKLRCENVNSPVQFNGTASYDPDGSIVSYEWGFGDGTAGTGASPKHTYTTYRWSGTAYQPFTANLTVTDNSGLTNSTSQKVVIWIAGDANGDGKVNILDAAIVGLKWNGNDPCADLNNDGKVNILDAAIIGLKWNTVA